MKTAVVGGEPTAPALTATPSAFSAFICGPFWPHMNDERPYRNSSASHRSHRTSNSAVVTSAGQVIAPMNSRCEETAHSVVSLVTVCTLASARSAGIASNRYAWPFQVIVRMKYRTAILAADDDGNRCDRQAPGYAPPSRRDHPDITTDNQFTAKQLPASADRLSTPHLKHPRTGHHRVGV